MRSGMLRDFITVERNNPVQGPSGEELDVWTTHLTSWVFLKAVDGDEHITGHQIRMRFADVMHTDRIIFGTRVFDIVSVLDMNGMGRELTIELREDTSG